LQLVIDLAMVVAGAAMVMWSSCQHRGADEHTGVAEVPAV
jgi:hypothetical protein